MRLRLRLRTFLLVVAVSGVLLAYATATWKGGGFAFQHRHAALAEEIDKQVEWDRDFLKALRPHIASGHSCGDCYGCQESLPARFAKRRRRLDRLESQIWWHRFWAGPVARQKGTIYAKVGHGGGPCWWGE